MTYAPTLPASGDGFVRRKFSVQECRLLIESGLLIPGKYELIEGDIVSKMGQSRLHIAVVSRIIAVLTSIFGGESIQSQAQIGIGTMDPYSDPEPDVAVLRGTVRDYLEREPDPAADLLLIVEASGTTLQGDTTTKARLYARHAVPEYWVVSIAARELVVFRNPTAEGFADVQTYSESSTISPLAASDSVVQIVDLLP